MDIGDIVALLSHPYEADILSTVISGEAQQLSPLMIITEVVKNARNEYDEKTGNPIVMKGSAQCKCVWYSTKSHKFEEEWLSSNSLKIIAANSTNEAPNAELINKQVVFKTLELELRKKKSSITSIIDSSVNKGTTKVVSLLSFVSPIFHVVEFKKNEQTNIHDVKYGGIKHKYSEWLIKGKWYNPLTDKMSEFLLPYQAFKTVPSPDKELLQRCNEHLKNNELLRSDDKKIIIKIEQLVFNSGVYTFRYLNYITNKMEEAAISDIAGFVPIPYMVLNRYPTLATITHVPSVAVLAIVTAAIPRQNFMRIKYSDRNEYVTTRVISACNLVNDAFGNPKYLDAYCNLRGERRVFNIDQIQSIEELDLRFV